MPGEGAPAAQPRRARRARPPRHDGAFLDIRAPQGYPRAHMRQNELYAALDGGSRVSPPRGALGCRGVPPAKRRRLPGASCVGGYVTTAAADTHAAADGCVRPRRVSPAAAHARHGTLSARLSGAARLCNPPDADLWRQQWRRLRSTGACRMLVRRVHVNVSCAMRAPLAGALPVRGSSGPFGAAGAAECCERLYALSVCPCHTCESPI